MDKLRLSWHFVAASAAKQDRLSFPNTHTGVCWTTHVSWRASIHLIIPHASALRPVSLQVKWGFKCTKIPTASVACVVDNYS